MLRVLELFAGIGACSRALKNIGYEIEIVDAVEIDEYAIKSYNAIHNTSFEPQDITKWDKNIKDIDILLQGTPCTSFSTAGKNEGGNKGSGTESSLMWDSIEIIKRVMPKYVIWENVKNLLSKRHQHNFRAYLTFLNNIGYNSYYKVLNAKDYGIPQNRERVFTISIRKDVDNNRFQFPQKQRLITHLEDFLDKEVDNKYLLNEEQIERIKLNKNINNKTEDNIIVLGNYMKSNYESSRVISPKGIVPTIKENHGTVYATYYNDIYRKLTPKEYWRLMGFMDNDFEKCYYLGVPISQLYKQAGNSIVVNVLEAILKNL